MAKNQLTGKVVSNKMLKTLVVEVERTKEHPKYKRRYKVSKKYKVHNEKGDYQVGDKVLIEECRPISKDKRWKVIKKLASEPIDEAIELNDSIKIKEPVNQEIVDSEKEEDSNNKI
jgi:small subunit ribosomal protein S17